MLQEKNNIISIAREHTGNQTAQYLNQQQIQSNTNKKEYYQQNIVINQYQEHGNLKWQ